MKSRVLHVVLLLLAAAVALAFRLPRLAERPMHADEAVQAARSRQLWLQGRYVYDPNEFHGPTLQYATLPSLRISGAKSFAQTSETTFRITPALFGAGAILLLFLLGDALGKSATLWAGSLMAVSTAAVFFSRYYIHETLLTFFTLAAIASGWRYAQSGRLAWCLATGVFLGLMQATKETAVIALVAMALATGIVLLGARLSGNRSPDDRPIRPAWHFGLGLAAGVAVAVVLFSSFFTNPRGPVDAVLTYAAWLNRAGGASPHVHPWHYYFQLLAWRSESGELFWSEGLILGLAAVGFLATLLRGRTHRDVGQERHERASTENEPVRSFVAWLGCYTVVLTVVYCAIPYKTPWCLLGFLQGMILLAGVGAAALLRITPTRPLKALIAIILAAGVCHLGWQSYRASFVAAADPGNPYAYAPTLPDAVRLADDLDGLAAAAPDGHATAIRVIWRDAYYWPLPWHLRKFDRVELWTHMPDDPAAPLVICSPEFDRALTERLDATHLMTGYYGVRPNVLAMLWVRMDVWEAHLRRLGRL